MTPAACMVYNVYTICMAYSYMVCVYTHICVLCLVTQSCPALCNPMDRSQTGSSVQGILQARILEWGCHAFPQGSSQPRDQTQASYYSRFFTGWATREVRVCISIHSLHGIKCIFIYMYSAGFPSGSVVKNLPAIGTDADSISGSERSPGGGNGNPL